MNVSAFLSRTANKRPSVFLAALTLAVVGAAVAYILTERAVRREAYQRFLDNAVVMRASLETRSKSYADLLRSGASLFRTAREITPIQFRDFFDGIDLRRQFPGVLNLNYAEYTPAAQLEATKAKLIAYAAQMPYMHLTDEVVYPPGQRDDYLVVMMIEPPSAGNYGADILERTKASSRPSMVVARDTGEMFSSGVPLGVVSKPHDPFIAARVPIYRHGQPVATLEQRRSAFKGSLGICVSINQLFDSVREESTIPARIVVTDRGDTIVKPRLLYDTDGSSQMPFPPAAVESADLFRTTVALTFNARPWSLAVSVEPARIYSAFDRIAPIVAAAAAFIGVLLFLAAASAQMKSRRRAREHHDLRLLADNSEKVKERERERIAREIHDDLGQYLMLLRIEADMLREKTDSRLPRLNARATNTLSQIDCAIRSLRRIINDLRPEVLDQGIGAAAAWQVAEFQRRTGIHCQLISRVPQERPDVEHHSTTCFRILQESLANISRHAHATEVKVTIGLAGENMFMTVSDNGVGLAAVGEKAGAFGLVGIRERAAMCGGHAEIDSPAAGGTLVSLYLPLELSAHASQSDHGQDRLALAG